MSTYGDVSAAQLAQIGGTGVFVTGVRAALLDGTADLAVHSLKDLPTGPADGIVLAAIPARDDPRDALVPYHGASLSQPPLGARIWFRWRCAAMRARGWPGCGQVTSMLSSSPMRG
jgi:hydroxymethylbilane synthase